MTQWDVNDVWRPGEAQGHACGARTPVFGFTWNCHHLVPKTNHTYPLCQSFSVHFSDIHKGCVCSERPAYNQLWKEIKAFSVRLTSPGKAAWNPYVWIFTFNTANSFQGKVDAMFLMEIKRGIWIPDFCDGTKLFSSDAAEGLWAPTTRPRPHSHTSHPSPRCYLRHLRTPWTLSCCLPHVWTDAESEILQRRRRCTSTRDKDWGGRDCWDLDF